MINDGNNGGATLRSITYVSRSLLVWPANATGIQDIVNQSRRRNAAAGITGALAATERSFLQCIEGDASAVGELMDRIRRDPRHTNVTVIEDRTIHSREFTRWSLAYCGPDSFIDDQLATWLQRGSHTPDAATAATLRARLWSMAAVA